MLVLRNADGPLVKGEESLRFNRKFVVSVRHIVYRLRPDEACASDANEDVIAEYAAWGPLLTDDIEELLLLRIA